MNKKQITIVLTLIIIIGSGMFFAGIKYEAKKTAVISQQQDQTASEKSQIEQVGQLQNRPGIDEGKVTAKDDVSVMIEAEDGSSKKIMFSDSTMVRKIDIVSVTDINQGQQISVRGKNTSDGAIEAQSVSILPKEIIK